MRLLLAAALAWAAGCGGCGACEKAPAPDTGLTPLPAPKHVERSTDLRAVLLLVMPEYRGINVTGGQVVLRRTWVRGATDWDTLLRETLAFNHFATDGGVSGHRGPLTLSLVKPGVMELSLPMTWDVAGSVFQAAAPLSSLTMGQYLPRDPLLQLEREEFDLEVQWQAVDASRGGFVAWQAVSLLLQNGQWKGEVPPGFEVGWQPDGAPGAAPAQFEVTLTGVVDGAQITVKRDGAKATVRYHLVTKEPAAP